MTSVFIAHSCVCAHVDIVLASMPASFLSLQPVSCPQLVVITDKKKYLLATCVIIASIDYWPEWVDA